MNNLDTMYDRRYENKVAMVVDSCKDCDCDLHEGEEYYDIEGTILCVDCIEEYKKEGF